jgi:hypothetical protein
LLSLFSLRPPICYHHAHALQSPYQYGRPFERPIAPTFEVLAFISPLVANSVDTTPCIVLSNGASIQNTHFLYHARLLLAPCGALEFGSAGALGGRFWFGRRAILLLLAAKLILGLVRILLDSLDDEYRKKERMRWKSTRGE